MAPEVFRHEPYNSRVDVYSFSMIVYQLFEVSSDVGVKRLHAGLFSPGSSVSMPAAYHGPHAVPAVPAALCGDGPG